MTTPTDAELVTAAGWNPRYAHLLVSSVVEDRAVAVVDTNGDGASVWIEAYWRDHDGIWHDAGGSGGEPTRVGTRNDAVEPAYGYSWGREQPNQVLDVIVAGKSVRVTTNALGWWAVILPCRNP